VAIFTLETITLQPPLPPLPLPRGSYLTTYPSLEIVSSLVKAAGVTVSQLKPDRRDCYPSKGNKPTWPTCISESRNGNNAEGGESASPCRGGVGAADGGSGQAKRRSCPSPERGVFGEGGGVWLCVRDIKRTKQSYR